MRKELILILAVLSFINFSGAETLIFAQSKRSNALYAAPTRLNLPGDEQEKEEPTPQIPLREHFFPIGWSKDGKFAFYTEPADEACGCYLADVYVQDMRTDKVLWSRRYSSDGDERKPQTLAAYWKQNQRSISAALAKYKIIAGKNFTLKQFPFEYQNDLLTTDLRIDLKTTDEPTVAGSVKLDFVSKSKGRKTLFEEKYSAEKYDSIRGAEVGGFLPSPFEPRAAIIVIETHRGYEGPPNITRLRLVGTSLMTNFR